MTRRRTPIACLTALAAVACAQTPGRGDREPPPEPAFDDEWHREPVKGRAHAENVVVVNHADPTFDCATIAELLQRQYEFLKAYVGLAPDWIFCHVGANYPCGMSVGCQPYPEMFLRASGIFDTQNDYAHEMMHCFMSQFGTLPHWFNESMSDMAYFDSEFELYKRRQETEYLALHDRVDYRSYELLHLRIRFGRRYFRDVCAALVRRRQEALTILTPGTDLESQNEFLLSVLSEAAGEDLRPLFAKDFGFNPRTRARQRGY
jgi:hypothetical protein